MKTKFGIVGCGFLGNIVADAWKKGLLEDYELVGVTSRTFASAAGVDVHILQFDLDLSALIFGLDGHGVLIRRAGDDGVGVAVGGLPLLGDVVAGVARFHGDVTILDAPCLRKGRGGKGGEHYGSQDKRCCPLRGRTG